MLYPQTARETNRTLSLVRELAGWNELNCAWTRADGVDDWCYH